VQRTVETPHENFDILDLERPRDWASLVTLVISLQAGLAPWAVLDYVLNRGCRAVVVERDYVDRDYARSYRHFYARSFRDLEKRTTRLHFFARPIRRASVSYLGRPRTAASYMGFCVLRPLAVRRIGRTVLKPQPIDPESEFPITAGRFHVNIGGSHLEVQGAAFMEQDARVASCASAATWMSTASIAARFGLPTYTTSEITEYATAYVVGERMLPSGGLTVDQIAEALRRMGYDPVTLPIRSSHEAMDVVYPYVESCIPPILLLRLVEGGHAMMAVGHTFDVSREPAGPSKVHWAKGEDPISVWRSWQWVDALLVHDDQRGPYCRLELLGVDTEELSSEIQGIYGQTPGFDINSLKLEEWGCPVRIDCALPYWESRNVFRRPQCCIGNLWGVIVPLPTGISLSALEAHDKVARILKMWYDGLGQDMPDDLYLRTYLIESNAFKEHVDRTRGLHRYARRMYLGKSMPRWLWVTEVGFRREVLTSRMSDQRIRGEVLLDANSSPWIPDFVALHMPLGKGRGHLTTMRPRESDVEAALVTGGWLLLGDQSYLPLHR
jgi:hypothetical protein